MIDWLAVCRVNRGTPQHNLLFAIYYLLFNYSREEHKLSACPIGSRFFEELWLIINSYIVLRISYIVSREGLSVSSDQAWRLIIDYLLLIIEIVAMAYWPGRNDIGRI